MTHDCSFLEELDLADDQLSFAEGRRESHAADWGADQDGRGVVPDAVVYPESTEDVSAVLAAATERGVPVTPYAAGTGLEGNAVFGCGREDGRDVLGGFGVDYCVGEDTATLRAPVGGV